MDKSIGAVNWFDLTVQNADVLKNFYKEVVGWNEESFSMGEYNDFLMKDVNGNAIAGICNAKGGNKDLPPFWLIYINVKNLDDSLDSCKRLNGKQVSEIRNYDEGRYCIIEDCAGAFAALYEQKNYK